MQRPLLLPAATVSLVAGLVGLGVVPQHFEDWWVYGALFLAGALGQSLYGTVLLLWPTRAILLTGVAGNAALSLVYISARSPAAGGTFSAVDLAAAALGFGLVAALGWMLTTRPRQDAATTLVPELHRPARLS